MTYTPGPWSVFTDVNGLHYVSAGRKCIHEFSGAVKIHDARLMAAAPDLLAALESVIDWLDDGNRILSDSCAADVAKARAAIAKAKGETA